MKNLNRITLIGQLTADPDAKKVSTGHALSSFRLATNYAWKDDNGEWKTGVDYHTVVAWEKLAESVAALYKKGESVFVEGKIRTNSWVAEDGTKRFSTQIVAKSILPMTSVAAKKRAADFGEEEPEEAWEHEPVAAELTVVPVGA